MDGRNHCGILENACQILINLVQTITIFKQIGYGYRNLAKIRSKIKILIYSFGLLPVKNQITQATLQHRV